MISKGEKLIVGLGNPGLLYSGSRHNVGFTVLKSLAVFLKTGFRRERSLSSLVAESGLPGSRLILALPQTYMNLSGVAVKALVKKFKIRPEDLLVVCDDLDLDLGRIKIRAQGSSGGQRGLQSIIEHLGGGGFCRLRIGIGRPPTGMDPAEYVLSGFSRREKEAAKMAQEEAVNCCLFWAEEGLPQAMNKFNKKSDLLKKRKV